MKIFLTGGTGFIGSNLINELTNNNHKVISTINKRKKTAVKLTQKPIWIQKPLNKLKPENFKKIDVLIHLASHKIYPPYDSLDKYLYWNVYAPLIMAKNACKAGVKKFIIIGSCFEYGKTSNQIKYLKPNSKLRPIDNYSFSKSMASLMFEKLSQNEKFIKIKILRLFHTFGEGEHKSRFYPSLIKAAMLNKNFSMTNGNQLRDFMHINTATKKIKNELNFKDMNKKKFIIKNIYSGNYFTLKNFAKYVWKEKKAKGKLIFNKKKRSNDLDRIIPHGSKYIKFNEINFKI